MGGGAAQAVAMAVIPLDDIITASTRETIRAVMEYLLQKYLNVEDYLLTTGLTPQELAAIRRNLMQPAAAAAGVAQA
jgi:5-bromo-4-chloroindolyl phosphate hydrolysis protein